ncbi:uncharacterized protein LY89DRAFT_737977 [Mollisia scopiformis]|uniref:Uncharacterized protein n=1 Tax=Mollisia scopiformis TaxID=149040 RepID=A0A194WZP0_MOLSC|nr:uncharacterized protein LY89DRAFT_737977 [Mollisia scopiformis]KUJ13082.1 hypothetical protein LY89DRAFT_737977 [Mollisia scopiformis]
MASVSQAQGELKSSDTHVSGQSTVDTSNTGSGNAATTPSQTLPQLSPVPSYPTAPTQMTHYQQFPTAPQNYLLRYPTRSHLAPRLPPLKRPFTPMTSRLNHTQVHVLALSFENHGLAETHRQEINKLLDTFQYRYNYTVTDFRIPENGSQVDSENAICKEIMSYKNGSANFGPSLLWVYYGGHGGHGGFSGGEFCLEGDTVPGTDMNIVRWAPIRNALASLYCDVIVVIDSCESGAAYDPNLELRPNGYRMDLLAACGTDKTTKGPGDFSFTKSIDDNLNQMADGDYRISLHDLTTALRNRRDFVAWALVYHAPNWWNLPRWNTETQPELVHRNMRDDGYSTIHLNVYASQSLYPGQSATVSGGFKSLAQSEMEMEREVMRRVQFVFFDEKGTLFNDRQEYEDYQKQLQEEDERWEAEEKELDEEERRMEKEMENDKLRRRDEDEARKKYNGGESI